MKFRTIYILFNVVILVSFCFVFLFPFFVLGAESSIGFWKDNWYLALFFLLLLGGINAFFIYNRKVFSLVEKEDWAALSAHLSDEIFAKGRFRASSIRLLVNAFLLRSDIAGIERLETTLQEKKPALLRKNALLFGVTRLLRNRPAEAEAFFARYLDSRDVESREWLRFDYAFSLVLQKRVSDAVPFLKEGLNSRDAVDALLSSYLLGSIGAAGAGSPDEKVELGGLAEATKTKLRSRFNAQRWSREVERAKGEVHIVILSKLIDDAGRWLFAAASEAAPTPEAAAKPTSDASPGLERQG
jgi:hypothetical protein